MASKYLVAYDLDGVLAEAPPPRPKSFFKSTGQERKDWDLLLAEHYRTAKPLLVPPEAEFHVITARKCKAPFIDITMAWLEKHYPDRTWRFHMLATGRTLKNVIAFKGSVIAQMGISKFTEDNREVLKGLRKGGVACELYYFDGKESTPF